MVGEADARDDVAGDERASSGRGDGGARDDEELAVGRESRGRAGEDALCRRIPHTERGFAERVLGGGGTDGCLQLLRRQAVSRRDGRGLRRRVFAEVRIEAAVQGPRGLCVGKVLERSLHGKRGDGDRGAGGGLGGAGDRGDRGVRGAVARQGEGGADEAGDRDDEAESGVALQGFGEAGRGGGGGAGEAGDGDEGGAGEGEGKKGE